MAGRGLGLLSRKDVSAHLVDHLRALGEAVELCDGRVDPAALAEAKRVVDQADRRLAMSGSATVVALAGATGSGKSSTFNALSGTTLATVNLMSMFGLHRRLRGAIVGHLAAFEITSPEPNGRYARGLRRLGAGPDATEFFDEHVEADAVHEAVAAHDLAAGLCELEPELAGDVLFGAASLLLLEARFATMLLTCWERGETSLRTADFALAHDEL